MSSPKQIPPFHLAFPVHDLAAARRFYGGTLGCLEGRCSDEWVDFNFFGHQIVTHLVTEVSGSVPTNHVDGHGVPVRHFGVVLPMDQWRLTADALRNAGIEFIIEPCTRFVGEPGEQATMFFRDPSGNAIEFKAFGDIGKMFEK